MLGCLYFLVCTLEPKKGVLSCPPFSVGFNAWFRLLTILSWFENGEGNVQIADSCQELHISQSVPLGTISLTMQSGTWPLDFTCIFVSHTKPAQAAIMLFGRLLRFAVRGAKRRVALSYHSDIMGNVRFSIFLNDCRQVLWWLKTRVDWYYLDLDLGLAIGSCSRKNQRTQWIRWRRPILVSIRRHFCPLWATSRYSLMQHDLPLSTDRKRSSYMTEANLKSNLLLCDKSNLSTWYRVVSPPSSSLGPRAI